MCICIVETEILKAHFWLSDIAFGTFAYIYLYITMYINAKN